jgi:hypothetical protein
MVSDAVGNCHLRTSGSSSFGRRDDHGLEDSYRELWTEGGRDYRKSRKDDWQQQSLKLNGRAGNSGAHPHVARGVSAVKSQSEGYRAKAKEYARPPPLSARQILAAHYRHSKF